MLCTAYATGSLKPNNVIVINPTCRRGVLPGDQTIKGGLRTHGDALPGAWMVGMRVMQHAIVLWRLPLHDAPADELCQ